MRLELIFEKYIRIDYIHLVIISIYQFQFTKTGFFEKPIFGQVNEQSFQLVDVNTSIYHGHNFICNITPYQDDGNILREINAFWVSSVRLPNRMISMIFAIVINLSNTELIWIKLVTSAS